MSRSMKKWLIAAALLFLCGASIFLATLAVLKWDFSRLATEDYVINEHKISTDFTSILIESADYDVQILPSEDGNAKIVCAEKENHTHSVSVIDGVLTVKFDVNMKWYDYIGIFSSGDLKITVYLPENEYDELTVKGSTGDVYVSRELQFCKINMTISTGDIECFASASEHISIKSSTGDIDLKGIKTGNLYLSVSTGTICVSDAVCEKDVAVNVSTGKAYLTDLECKSLSSKGDTGDITLENVIATSSFNIKRTTGDVTMKMCDAQDICVNTSTGDVFGTLLTKKEFSVDTSTGNISHPSSYEGGGKCEIKTSTGDILIKIEGN